MLCPSSLFTTFQDPFYIWSESLSLTYIIFNLRVLMSGSGMQILNKMLTLNFHTFQGNSHNSIESNSYKSWWNCFHSESSRPTVFHGSGWKPIEPCVKTFTLWDDRCVLGSRWEDLTLTPWGLDDGQPDLLVLRYVDTDQKAVPSYGWYIWMKSIISIVTLMASIFINLLS